MLTIAIDRGDQLRKGHAALTGDLLQTVPELVFEADARLMACNDNRALRNRRLHGSVNQRSVLYDRMALWARKPAAWCHQGVFLLRPCRRQRYGAGLHAAATRDWERHA